MKTDEKIMKAKSVHIFAWPFYFQREKKRSFEKKELFKEKGWRKKELDCTDTECQDTSNCFMLHQYLSLSARKVFVNGEKSICSVYEYPFEKGRKYEYYIKKENKEYSLPIATIELHLYNYNVGILFIQVWNQNYDIDDIKWINDYGRRVTLPYLAKKNLLCADKLGVLVDGNFVQEIDFLKMSIKCLDADKKLAELKKASETTDFLDNILNCNLHHNGINDISVTPYTDDRMFVCTLIRDTELSAMIQNGMEDEELLYSILFVDSSDATCQNGEMRKKLFEDAVYKRWSDYGTLYGATAYSFCCLTTDNNIINESVVRPFLVEYSYFVSLVLAQRIGMISFTEETGRAISDFNNKRNRRKNGIGYIQAAKLSWIQKQYVDFKNRLLILEASTQDQGIEIYQLLQKQLLVRDEQEILDGKLQSLYEAANISIGNRLTIVGLIFSFAALFSGLGYEIVQEVYDLLMRIIQ